MTEWKTLSKQEAAKRVAEWKLNPHSWHETGGALGSMESSGLNESYWTLRNELLRLYDEARERVDSRPTKVGREYQLDLEFGLRLYELMTAYGLSPRTASYDPVWNYLSVAVVPDLVYERYGGFREDRFYAKKRRIWLKMLWWYIFLGMQQTDGSDDLSRTREVLADNTTDTIMQIVDRAGTGGYRVDVTREIMRRYAEVVRTDRSGRLLEQIMMLHVARARMVEPALAAGGVPGYVDMLFRYYDVQQSS